MSKNTKLYLQTLLHSTGLTENDVLNTIVDFDTKSFINKAREYIGENIEHGLNYDKLHPILPTIGQDNFQNKKVFRAERLNNNEAVFAIDDQDIQIKTLLDDLKNEINTLKNYEDNNLLKGYTAYHILYAYGSRMSLGKKASVISLFDRNRVLAAVANCLCDKDGNEYTLEEKQPFILIKGAISGIQEFIYNDIDKSEVGNTRQLAKKLRGRSSYVGLLTDIVAEQLAEKLGLEMANVIFSGGGNFNIVVPNIPQNEVLINDFIGATNKMLQAKMGNRISLLIASDSCGNDLFTQTNKYYQQINDTLERRKTQKHLNYIDTIFQNAHIETNFTDDLSIGESLPKADFLIELKTKTSLTKKTYSDIALSFDAWNLYYLVPQIKIGEDIIEIKRKIAKALSSYANQVISCKIIALNNTRIFSQLYDLQADFDFPIGFGFKFMGKYTPKGKIVKNNNDSKTKRDKIDVLSFEELAALDHTQGDNGEILLEKWQTLDFHQLAVMRWDIDDLGSLFAFGLETPDFPHIATFSREIHLFFSGYINILAEKYQLYIVYSGGDDAFIIGSWYNVLRFARELHQKFQEFTCNNEDIGYSAGIFMCHPKYPVARFADDAAGLEESSKYFPFKKESIQPNENPLKNAVTVFNRTLSWIDFENMMDFADTLLEHTHEGGHIKDRNKLARSMVHRLLSIIQSCYDEKGVNISTRKLKQNMSRLHYLFARHGFTYDEIQNAKTKLIQSVIRVILNEFQKEELIENYKIPLQYVLLKTRKI